MKRIAVYPGTFDPVTNGHIDIIVRAAALFDKVIVAVATNLQKQPMFTVEERMDMIQYVVRDVKNIEIDKIDGLVVDFAQGRQAHAIIRGLRAMSDFEYELQMALVNRKLNDELTTVFLMPHERYTYLNSSIVKELISFDGQIDCFVPEYVKQKLLAKVRERKAQHHV